MSSIDNGVTGLLGSNPVAKGKSAESAANDKSIARSSEFAEAYASVAGRSGDQNGYRFKARGADGEGQDGENEGRGSKRLQLSGFASAERSLSKDRVAGEGEEAGKHLAEEAADPVVEPNDVEQADGGKQEGPGPEIGAIGSKPAGKGVHAGEAGEITDGDGEEDGNADPGASQDGDVGVLLSLLAGGEQGQGQVVSAHGEPVQRSAAKPGSGERRGDGQKEAAGQVAAGERATAHLAADPAAGADMAEIGADPSDADQVFKLIRADGKGREVELSIGRGEARAANETANPAVRVETVTVVDARRYIGLADVGNSAAVTAAIAQDREWASALTASSSALGEGNAATGKVVNTLKIQMQPIDLGMVTATLRLSGEELVVDLQVETGEAYRQLTDDKDRIVKALRGNGFTVDQVNVQFSSVDRSSGTGQGGAQTQLGGQQNAHEGGGGRQGGQQPSGDWNGFATGEGLGNEQISTNGGVAGTQSDRAGGVYL